MAQKNGTKSRGHGPKRSKLDSFLNALLVARTIEEAAAQAHISRRTATRWLGDPSVQARRQQQARQAAREATMRIEQMLTKAAARLDELLDGENENVRLGAVRLALDYHQRAIELVELRERLERLEQIAKSAAKGNYEQPISSASSGTVGKTNGSA
jgi:hypothetical protein